MHPAQHQPSNALKNNNAKYTTDNYLVSDLQLQDNLMDIEFKKNAYEYLEVSDDQIAQLRDDYNNEISRGDALSIILTKEWKEYEGLVNDNGDDHDDSGHLQTASESAMIKTPKKKKIVDAVYDHVNGISYYFLK